MRIEPLSEQDCSLTTFTELLDDIHPGEGERYLPFLRSSFSVYSALTELVKSGGESVSPLIIDQGELKKWVVFFGVFVDGVLVGIGGCKYQPPEIKIRVKEEKGKIYPIESKQFFHGDCQGQDCFHLISLPAYLEIGPTVIEDSSRGKGYFAVLHQTRLRFLLEVSESRIEYPNVLLIGSTGPLRTQLASFYQCVDRFQPIIPRFKRDKIFIPDTI